MTQRVLLALKIHPPRHTYTHTQKTPKSRRAPIPADMANDPASITKEALGCLLDMSVQGKGVVLGPDPVTGTCVHFGWMDGCMNVNPISPTPPTPPPNQQPPTLLSSTTKTGADIVLRATKSGRSLEVQDGENALHKVQVPSSVDAANCPPGAFFGGRVSWV